MQQKLRSPFRDQEGRVTRPALTSKGGETPPLRSVFVLCTFLLHEPDEIIERDFRTHSEYQLTDGLQLMLEYGERLKVEFINSLHCGTPDQLLDANRSTLQKRTPQAYRFPNSVIIPPVFIGEDTVIEKAIIGPYVSIGRGTRVINAIIKDAIIHPNAEIQDALTSQSLIGPHARVHGDFHQFNIDSSAQINLPNLS